MGGGGLRALLLNLPSPPRMNVGRDFCGGFGGSEPSPRRRYGHDVGRLTVIPPLYEAYAAALMKERSFQVRILDCQAEDLDIASTMSKVRSEAFDLVVARISLPSLQEDVEILAQIKKAVPNATVVAWGPVCSALPERVLSRKGADLLVSGEIEFALAEIAERLERGDDLKSIPGLLYAEDGQIRASSPRPPIQDLDSLPLPDYESLKIDLYLDRGKVLPLGKGPPERLFTVLSSRGCRFRCEYCPYRVMFGDNWRAMSPERTLREVERVVTHRGIKRIWFRDQTWNADVERSKRICELIIERGLSILWRAEMRADLVTPELAELMREAGCVNAQIGVETGDPEMLAKAKPGMSLEKLKAGADLLMRAGVRVTANVMVGLPNETWSSIARTAQLLREMRPARVNVAIVEPYPGTELHSKAAKLGWLAHTQRGDALAGHCDLSPRELKAAQRYLLDLGRPQKKYMRLLRSLRGFRFGEAAAELTSAFEQVRLERRLNLQRTVMQSVSEGDENRILKG